MTSHKYALAIKVQALNALLDDPRADDDDWCVDLLYTLEAIYDIALHPDVPIVAASRSDPLAASWGCKGIASVVRRGVE